MNMFGGVPNGQSMGKQIAPMGSATWINGYNELSNFDVLPNTWAVFFDSSVEGRYYVKFADTMGRPSVRIFDSTEITDKFTSNGIDTSMFVTKKDLEDLIKAIGGNNNGKQSIQSAESTQSAEPKANSTADATAGSDARQYGTTLVPTEPLKAAT